MKKRLNDTEKTSCRIRSHVVDMSYRSKTAEIGSALCISDILTVLYFNILNINPKKPKDEKRDYFVLSKGHGAAALYATLAERGFFPTNKLEKYRVNDGIFHGHPSRGSAPGIEVSTGSLGHGLSIGTGIALTLKKENPKGYRLWRLIQLINYGLDGEKLDREEVKQPSSSHRRQWISGIWKNARNT